MRLPGIVAFAFVALAAPLPYSGSADARPTSPRCGADTYVNMRGDCVHRPMRADRAPAGATAKCRDGTYSFSQSRRGTCSWHRGVAKWLSGQ
jgi:hypothetical protein